MVKIIPAEESHIPLIAARMREADRLELSASMRSPKMVLHDALVVSDECWTGMLGGEAACMFGVAPVGFMFPDIGRPWMLGTDLLDEHATRFLRRCRPQVRKMLDRYPVLVNYVDSRNVRAVDWLRWLGFTVGPETTPVGLANIPFYRFEMRRPS